MASRQTQQRIVDAAIGLFNEHGTPAVSTNRIAAVCGVSRGNLHYHFRTKQALIQRIFAQIADEMNTGWYRDPLQPNLLHMAEMFARQALLIYHYRFFYREMPHLLRADSLLLRRYQESWRRRVPALERFFLELDRREALHLNGDRELIRSLVHGTWIITDNWLNSMEFLGREVTEDSLMSGYELVLAIFRPYIRTDERLVLHESQAAIRRHVRSCATRPPREPQPRDAESFASLT